MQHLDENTGPSTAPGRWPVGTGRGTPAYSPSRRPLECVDVLGSECPTAARDVDRLDPSLPDGSDECPHAQAGATDGIRWTEEPPGHGFTTPRGPASCADDVRGVHAADDLADGSRRDPGPVSFDDRVVAHQTGDVLVPARRLVGALGFDQRLPGPLDRVGVSSAHVCQCDRGLAVTQQPGWVLAGMVPDVS